MGEKIQAIRAELKLKSETVAPLVKLGQFENINEGIIAMFYRNEENKEFNTYNGWKENGYQVKKGSKAFHIWSRPLDVLQKEKNPEAVTDEEQGRYFPVAFIFSNAQVRKIEPTDEDNTGGKVVPIRSRNGKEKAA